jgi:cysteine desulfurase/selenocysteine lyase
MSIYLDNAATTFPKPEQVYEAVTDAMRRIGASPGRGGYRQALEASRLVFQAREAVASLFGIGDSSRVIFTHSATEALNLAVRGLLRPGDHVVTTSMEHNSLVRPLKLAEKDGVEVTWVRGDRFGMVDVRELRDAVRMETRLLALSHCSNVTGAVQPIQEISSLTRESKTALLVDAAQSAGSLPLDVREMNIDILAAPGHKGLFGPQGTGFLYVAEGIVLSPLLVGGTGGFSSLDEQPEELPERFESGTLNLPAIAGLKAGVEFVMSEGVSAIREKEAALVGQLLEGISSIPGAVHYSPSDPAMRGGVVSFTVNDMDPAEIGFRLDREFDIAVRVGLHCAPHAHRTIGTYPQGTVRVSPGFFNTHRDVETFLLALRSIIIK